MSGGAQGAWTRDYEALAAHADALEAARQSAEDRAARWFHAGGRAANRAELLREAIQSLVDDDQTAYEPLSMGDVFEALRDALAADDAARGEA